MADTQPNKKSVLLSPFGRDEMNLVEVPFTLLLKKTQHLKETPKTIEGKDFVITGSEKYGLPLFFGEEVYIGLMAISRAQDFKERQVHFSPWSLINLIKWKHNGQSYSRLENSLLQLKGVSVYFKNFWDNELQKRVKMNFGVLSNFMLVPERRGRKSSYQNSLPSSWIRWDDILFKSIQSGFVKVIDLERYQSYKLPTTKRAFRYFDKHFHKQGEFSIDIFDFAFEVLGFVGNYEHVSRIRQKLQPCFDELVADKFIFPPQYRVNKSGRVEIEFKKCPSMKIEQSVSVRTKTLHDPLRSRLELFDNPPMNKAQIEFCVREDNRKKTQVALEIIEQRIKIGEKIDNRPAYLYKLVRDGFMKSKGLESSEEKQEKIEKKEEVEKAIVALAAKIQSGEMKSFTSDSGEEIKIDRLLKCGDPTSWCIEFCQEKRGRKYRVAMFLKDFLKSPEL